ncbi:hypothetical protein OPIT5_08330 [Opitutaceae bacterium TAV5]|nr:hypothetical protein OPIT5_08330 [Opitutaceae bacterium TAV5]
MSTGMAIAFDRDEVSPLLAALGDDIRANNLSMVMGRGVGNLTRQWLFDLNNERHRHGRVPYYQQAARSVTVNKTDFGAAISATQTGIRLRRFGSGGLPGGVVKPRPGKKYLTLPDEDQPEAHGLRAREFNDLKFSIVMDKNGALRPALVRRASTAIRFVRRKQKDGSIKTTVKAKELRDGEVMFWLVRQTRHRPDPSILPPGPMVTETAVQAALRRVAEIRAERAAKATPDNP